MERRKTRTWLTRTRILDQVAEWATTDTDTDTTSQLITDDELDATVQLIRHGQLDADQREALAVFVSIAASVTLPTPVIAAVLNVINTCKRTSATNE